MFPLVLSLLTTVAFSAEFDWQSHRGARGLYPENTVGAMKEALKYPVVTTLELDVVVSKDGEVVVSHEPWMSDEICLDSKGKVFKGRIHNIYKMNYREIASFDCGSKKHPRFPEQKKVKEVKPLLKDLLASLKSANLPFNIEIKSLPEDEAAGFQPDVASFSDKVLSVINQHLTLDQFTIQSFDWRVLKYIHHKNPKVKLVALREEKYKAQDVVKELGFDPAVFSPDYKLLTKEDIEFFQKKGIKVIPWTVNTTEEMTKLKKMGVDGIITDYPNRIPKL